MIKENLRGTENQGNKHMRKILIAFFILFSTPIFAESYYGYLNKGSFLRVEELFVEYRKYEVYRNPYYPPEKNDWTHTGEFHWTVSILNRLYWENNFHMSMDETPQVRHGGWEYYMGFRVFNWLHAIKYHHSEHVFEDKFMRKFPVEDSYGIRIYFKR